MYIKLLNIYLKILREKKILNFSIVFILFLQNNLKFIQSLQIILLFKVLNWKIPYQIHFTGTLRVINNHRFNQSRFILFNAIFALLKHILKTIKPNVSTIEDITKRMKIDLYMEFNCIFSSMIIYFSFVMLFVGLLVL